MGVWLATLHSHVQYRATGTTFSVAVRINSMTLRFVYQRLDPNTRDGYISSQWPQGRFRNPSFLRCVNHSRDQCPTAQSISSREPSALRWTVTREREKTPQMRITHCYCNLHVYLLNNTNQWQNYCNGEASSGHLLWHLSTGQRFRNSVNLVLRHV
jgi:hypothetical protein